VKRRIQAEIVFDKPVMLINVCNQLGNCYLRINCDRNARENFENSLVLIDKLSGTSEKVSNEVISAIYLNLGAISSSQGNSEEALEFYERCLGLRERSKFFKDFELIKCYELLGLESLKANLPDNAVLWFQKAVYSCKNEFGES